MQTSEDHPTRVVAIWWRFPLALLLGALAGALGGLTASALSLGVLMAAIVARVLFAPLSRSLRQAVTIDKQAGTVISLFMIIILALFFLWEVTDASGILLGLGGPAFVICAVAAMLLGSKERSQRVFWTSVGYGVAAGLGTLLGFQAVSPTGLLTLQFVGVVLGLAAGGGLLGALIWLLVAFFCATAPGSKCHACNPASARASGD